ncbi:hypothetical protein BT69DRAFT_1022146 [Atractiella rhizophila]|nr:hypothetical protein BT69DRAFT_1022146 [Atractiella rhizophila]
MSSYPYYPYAYPPGYGQYASVPPQQSRVPVWGQLPPAGRGFSTGGRTQARGIKPTFKNRSLVLNNGSKASTASLSAPPKDLPMTEEVEMEMEEGQIEESPDSGKGKEKEPLFVRRTSNSIVSEELARKIAKRKLQLQMNKQYNVKKSAAFGASINSWKPKTRTPTTNLRQRIDKQCAHFSKTGICTRANICPYNHDSSKVSICQKSLRNKCPHSSSDCTLSHTPNEYRMPHCRHFPNCTRPQCPYPHVKLSDGAKVCKDFASLGYCEKGTRCTEQHTWECEEFAEKGTCTAKACSKSHVIRRAPPKEEIAQEEAPQMEVNPPRPVPEEQLKLKTGDAIVDNEDFVGFVFDSEGDDAEDEDGDEEDESE